MVHQVGADLMMGSEGFKFLVNALGMGKLLVVLTLPFKTNVHIYQ